jgi:hypothetical protein
MGAIKDITDLTITLLNSKEGRKFSAEIAKIQSFTLALQAEQSAIVEKNSDLLTENLNLKHKAFDLEKTHAQEMAALNAEISELQSALAQKNRHFLDDYEFFPRTGLYKKKSNGGHFVCGKCLPKNTVSPVLELEYGWSCKVCEAYFENPDKPVPQQYPEGFGGNPFSRHSTF